MAHSDGNSEEGFDGLVRRVDPDRWLASRFVGDPAKRADLMVLYAYDHELARAVQVASNPLLAEMRLTWWIEALEEIFGGRTVRRHPTVEALSDVIARRHLPRDLLEAMIEGRVRDLGDGADLQQWAHDTGGAAAVLAAMILDPEAEAEAARLAGVAWALDRRKGEGGDLANARAAARRLSIAAFPAAAHACLNRFPPGWEGLRRRLRLLLTVATGRL